MTGTSSTLTDLMADCDAHGIRLALTGSGGLEIDAPQDALTPDLLARLKTHKPALLAMLRSRKGVNIFGGAAGTLLRLFDEPPGIRTPEPLLSCFGRYRHRAAWRSIHGPHWVCSTCHPPAKPEIVAETAKLDADGGLDGGSSGGIAGRGRGGDFRELGR